MPNPFVHVELHADDPAKARAFYQALFGWEFQDTPGMDYTLIQVGEGVGGGMMRNQAPGTPPHWLPYVLVEDAAASAAKAKDLGAVILNELTEIPGYGRFCVIRDPDGAVLAMWQPLGMK